MKREHFFDYLYYAFDAHHSLNFRLLLVPYLFCVPLICSLIPNHYIRMVVAVAIGLVLYIALDHIYNGKGGRGAAVVKHFKTSKYNKTGWKSLAIAVWFIIGIILPILAFKAL